jgi:hypothetical protein
MEPKKKRLRAAFYCDACEVGFDYKSKYVRHVNVVGGEFDCEFNESGFSQVCIVGSMY